MNDRRWHWNTSKIKRWCKYDHMYIYIPLSYTIVTIVSLNMSLRAGLGLSLMAAPILGLRSRAFGDHLAARTP